ncbi:MAG: DUF6883 domain-containing protein [Cytophagales bacterium]
MARLTNFENAFIDINKLTEYSLNEHHPFGKEKAVVFRSVLGIGINEADLLKSEILKGLAKNECIEREQDEFGKRFSIIMKIRIFDKEAFLTTGWIIRSGENFPRLTSCYIKKRSK